MIIVPIFNDDANINPLMTSVARMPLSRGCVHIGYLIIASIARLSSLKCNQFCRSAENDDNGSERAQCSNGWDHYVRPWTMRAHLVALLIAGIRCARCWAGINGHYEWRLSNVKRLDKPRKPKRMPQPVWFRPF